MEPLVVRGVSGACELVEDSQRTSQPGGWREDGRVVYCRQRYALLTLGPVASKCVSDLTSYFSFCFLFLLRLCLSLRAILIPCTVLSLVSVRSRLESQRRAVICRLPISSDQDFGSPRGAVGAAAAQPTIAPRASAVRRT
jgi:hypothetical protein